MDPAANFTGEHEGSFAAMESLAANAGKDDGKVGMGDQLAGGLLTMR